MEGDSPVLLCNDALALGVSGEGDLSCTCFWTDHPFLFLFFRHS